jgi:hypothetical protein
MVLAAKNIN